MPDCEVLVKAEGAAGLASAWVYIQDGGTTTTYRTDATGRLCKLADGPAAGDEARPWKYTGKAVLTVPKTVRIFASQGARPIPQNVLNQSVFSDAKAYAERTIALPAAPPASPVASTSPTTVALVLAEVLVPPLGVTLIQPCELCLCPVLWDQIPEHETDDTQDYLRAGIPQGASTPVEMSASPKPPVAVTVCERGVKIQGALATGAAQVRIRLFDPAGGAAVGLRTSPTGSRVEEIVAATMVAEDNASFEVGLWLDDPTAAFGLVHLVVESKDTTAARHVLDAFTIYLVGMQIALVDDSTANLNGSAAGPVQGEAHEKVVLGFPKSPVRDVPSSDLFLTTYRVKKKQADKVVSGKTAALEKLRVACANLQKPRNVASTALASAVAQTNATQAKAKLTAAKTKLTALRTAVTNAALAAKITTALADTPTRDATGDATFDATMVELATALTAVNALVDPPCTLQTTALNTALTTAEQQIDEALAQVAIEVASSSTPAQKAAAHAARVAATSSVSTQLQAVETARTTAQAAAKTAHDTLANKTGPAKTALAHADTRNATLLQNAKTLANTELAKVRRARRMVRYQIRGDQKRKFNGTGPEVPHPQMPLFMAELHVLGISKAALEEMLVRRKRHVPALPGVASPEALKLEIAWALRMQWKGPDCDPPVSPPPTFKDSHPGGYTLDQEFRGVWTATKLQAVSQTVVIAVGGDDTVKVEGDLVKDAFSPAPVKLPFPVSTRRTPVVAIANRQRPWGRRQGAKNGSGMVVEWQIPIVDNQGNEILRGGDGTLTVQTLTVDGQAIDRGISATVGTATADLHLPPFRVFGENLVANMNNATDPLAQTAEAVIAEVYNALPATHPARQIDVAGWKLAYRRVMQHESGARQFNSGTKTDARHWEGNMVWSYGQEKGMPLHGHPHGFTIAQCDPHPSDNAMWSYVEAMRAGVGVLFDKAKIAKHDLEQQAQKANAAYQAKIAAGGTAQDPMASLDLTIRSHQEALLRGAAKRYNGGEEFVWGHPHGYVAPPPPAVPAPMGWVISPSIKNDYPNSALGTNVNYSSPEPIAFTAFVLPP